MLRDWSRFASLLEGSHKILISSHAKADGDAIGSELALAAALRTLGFSVTVLNPDLPAGIFAFMGKDFGLIRSFDGDPQAMTLQEAMEFDVLIVVDTSARAQLRKVADLIDAGLKTIVIDHHAVAEPLTPYEFSDPLQPAAGCLVLDLIESLGVPLSHCEENSACSIADFLFFAIATDTGWFRFPSVLPETMTQAATLMRAGASSARLYRCAYENYAPSRLKLLGVLAANSVLECGGRLAWSTIRSADFERLGATMADTTDLVNAMMMTAGVEVVLLFTETAPRSVRLNFRSRGDFNVAEIARLYGGGGHKNAAGGTFSGEFPTAVETVTAEVRQRLQG